MWLLLMKRLNLKQVALLAASVTVFQVAYLLDLTFESQDIRVACSRRTRTTNYYYEHVFMTTTNCQCYSITYTRTSILLQSPSIPSWCFSPSENSMAFPIAFSKASWIMTAQELNR